jgi:hypothetical protein
MIPTQAQIDKAKRLFVQLDMLLPDGKTCGDCIHIRRCTGLGVTNASRESCDWSPSRFRVPAAAHAAGGDTPLETPTL